MKDLWNGVGLARMRLAKEFSELCRVDFSGVEKNSIVAMDVDNEWIALLGCGHFFIFLDAMFGEFDAVEFEQRSDDDEHDQDDEDDIDERSEIDEGLLVRRGGLYAADLSHITAPQLRVDIPSRFGLESHMKNFPYRSASSATRPEENCERRGQESR